MFENDHDTLARRLTEILIKLNQGERLDPQQLAHEFGVNLRTIQRDLNERFGFLPLDKKDGLYSLDPAYLGRLGLADLDRFASLAGVRGLYPSLCDKFLRDLLDSRLQSALLVKGPQYEDLGSRQHDFKQLEQAILGRRHISFVYRKPDGPKSYAALEPYKLVNHSGIWYLAAKDADRLKAFSFSKIESLLVSCSSCFSPDSSVETTLAEQDNIWLNPAKQEVILQVAGEVADYFRRRPLIADQQIVEELPDGGLILATKIAHPNQILPTVRHWIPHVRIVSPEGLQGEMEEGLRAYLSAPS